MDEKEIKNIVQHYQDMPEEEIEKILHYIKEQQEQELGANIELELDFVDGCMTYLPENGQQKVVIDISKIYDLKNDKIFGLDVSSESEKAEFIDIVLGTFHELRHVKQYQDTMVNPVKNEDTIKQTREMIINDAFTGFRNDFNYEESMIEIDAMKASLEETVQFFEEMGVEITPDEVFKVMKEKELSILNYDLKDFGNNYETAFEHLKQIYGQHTNIKGMNTILKTYLSEDKKQALSEKCQGLMAEYNKETDVERKLDLLAQMSLEISPELREKYPLSEAMLQEMEQNKDNKEQENEQPINEFNQQREPSVLDKVSNGLDGVINGMDNFQNKMEGAIDNVIVPGMEKVLSASTGLLKSYFTQTLAKAGISLANITGITSMIKSVNPRKLVSMDRLMNIERQKEQNRAMEEELDVYGRNNR